MTTPRWPDGPHGPDGPDGPDGPSDLAGLRADLAAAGVHRDDVARVLQERREAEAMLARILATPPAAAAPGPSPAVPAAPSLPPTSAPRRRSLLGRAVLVATAAAVLVVAMLAIDTREHGGRVAGAVTSPPLLHFDGVDTARLPEGSPAGAVLDDLAGAAGSTPVAPSTGPVQHVRSVGWFGYVAEADRDAASVLQAKQFDSWFAPDGTLRLVESTGRTLDRDGRVADPASLVSGAPGERGDETRSHPDPGPDWAAGLPSDPAALTRALGVTRATCPVDRGGCLLNQIESLETTYVVPPRLQAALWRAIAAEPEVVHLGRTRDRLGRLAEVFAASSRRGAYRTLVFGDPDTGAWLGSETVLVQELPASGFDPPAVTEFRAVVTSELTAQP